jgi:hypothetical protein
MIASEDGRFNLDTGLIVLQNPPKEKHLDFSGGAGIE